MTVVGAEPPTALGRLDLSQRNQIPSCDAEDVCGGADAEPPRQRGQGKTRFCTAGNCRPGGTEAGAGGGGTESSADPRLTHRVKSDVLVSCARLLTPGAIVGALMSIDCSSNVNNEG